MFYHRSSQAEVKLEDATEKVGEKKKKKVYKEYDENEDMDYVPDDDDKDEDFVL